jgi:hypothetical protein
VRTDASFVCSPAPPLLPLSAHAKPDETNSREKKADHVHRRPLHLRCPPPSCLPVLPRAAAIARVAWRSLRSRRTAAAGSQLAAGTLAQSQFRHHSSHHTQGRQTGKRDKDAAKEDK